MTEQLHFPFSLSCIGEGNGNPLQCSCLEDPRDGGAWWAAIYGVAQSWTWLNRLSSSRPLSYTTQKINLKWTKDPKPQNSCKTTEVVKFLEISLGNDFFGLDTKAKVTKVKINMWDSIKLKSFLQQRKQPTKWKGNLLTRRKYSQIIALIRG